jgi:hypothetical protein
LLLLSKFREISEINFVKEDSFPNLVYSTLNRIVYENGSGIQRASYPKDAGNNVAGMKADRSHLTPESRM